MLRRAFVCLVLFGLPALAVPGAASALPTVKFKAIPLPIKGFPGTGYILGAGAQLETNFEITGSEYFGSPPPVIGINVYFPKGTVLHPNGFPTCPEETIVKTGPIGCAKGSAAGPVGSALGYVTFGGERVEESVEVFSFYKPGGGIEFFADGHSPVSLEVLSKGRYVNLTGPGPYGVEAVVAVPLVASVPGAPYASVKTITGRFGSAIRLKGKPVYYGRIPSTCPAGGFSVKTEVIFAENGEESRPEPVTVSYTAPCPRK
ncbi:MAG TPA: hypothetical protein VGY13_07650 [Solirubrobacteraceae bacterium]|jgi:hypothetical protein|nr:hypothetical protein [Solirubrobacteraceae bacterium]